MKVGGAPREVLVVGRSGRRARAGGLGGSFRTPPHPRKIPPARTKRVDDRQGGVWGTGQIAGVLPPHTHTHTRTPHHTACLPRSRTFRSLAPFSLTRFSAPSLPPLPPLLDCAEYKKICLQTIIGFTIMGFIGFFVKLIFIPINNIIMGGNAEAATEAAAA